MGNNASDTEYQISPVTDYLYNKTKYFPDRHKEWCLYAYPILLFFGIAGNGFMITGMFHREMRVTCFGVIMIATGVIHSLKLFFELLFWLNVVFMSRYGTFLFKISNLEVCLVLEFLKQFTLNGACWITVALAIERFCAQIGNELTWECGMTKIGIATALSGILTTRSFLVTKYFAHLQPFGCQQTEYDVWLSNLIQPMVGVYVPVLAVAILTGLIIFCRRWRLDEDSRYITTTAVVLCITFVVLFIPKTVVGVLKTYKPSYEVELAEYPVQFVWLSYFALPFYICLLFCPEMSYALGVLFGCRDRETSVKPVSYMKEEEPEPEPKQIGMAKPPIDQDFIKMLQNRKQ